MSKLSKILFIFILTSIFTACLPLVAIKKSLEQKGNFPVASNQPKKEVLAESFELNSERGKFEQEIYQHLKTKNFGAIEKIASEVRKNKSRLPGGYWKIDSVYMTLTTFYAEYPGQRVTDELWKNRIELLKNWKENSPNSITARVALAKAYLDYGWFARGFGYSNTVSNQDRKLLEERMALAENELFEAKNLPEKCPRWYRELLFFGMANGWASEDFNAFFEEAIKFEPNYLQFYLVKSEKSSPKWGGKQGEWQAFVDSLPSKLVTFETDEANSIYFVVVAAKLDDNSFSPNYAMFSKERIKQGFEHLEKKYGADNYRLNQFAHLSTMIGDFPSAQKAFERIGSNRHKEVWGEQTFNMMKELAQKGFPSIPSS